MQNEVLKKNDSYLKTIHDAYVVLNDSQHKNDSCTFNPDASECRERDLETETVMHCHKSNLETDLS